MVGCFFGFFLNDPLQNGYCEAIQFFSFFFSAIEETNTLNTCDNYKYQNMLRSVYTINITSKHVKMTKEKFKIAKQKFLNVGSHRELWKQN